MVKMSDDRQRTSSHHVSSFYINIPEGLSVGVSYASDAQEIGNLIAFAIGLQNAPEGFLVAVFLMNQKSAD